MSILLLDTNIISDMMRNLEGRAATRARQASVHRGADARELSALWARRNVALRQLIQASGEGIVAADDGGVTRL